MIKIISTKVVIGLMVSLSLLLSIILFSQPKSYTLVKSDGVINVSKSFEIENASGSVSDKGGFYVSGGTTLEKLSYINFVWSSLFSPDEVKNDLSIIENNELTELNGYQSSVYASLYRAATDSIDSNLTRPTYKISGQIILDLYSSVNQYKPDGQIDIEVGDVIIKAYDSLNNDWGGIDAVASDLRDGECSTINEEVSDKDKFLSNYALVQIKRGDDILLNDGTVLGENDVYNKQDGFYIPRINKTTLENNCSFGITYEDNFSIVNEENYNLIWENDTLIHEMSTQNTTLALALSVYDKYSQSNLSRDFDIMTIGKVTRYGSIISVDSDEVNLAVKAAIDNKMDKIIVAKDNYNEAYKLVDSLGSSIEVVSTNSLLNIITTMNGW